MYKKKDISFWPFCCIIVWKCFPLLAKVHAWTLISSEYLNKTIAILSAHTLSSCSPVLGTTAHTEDTTKATRSHSWLIYTAAIQMRIAQDVWWFSNLGSCHQEMGRVDPCHPHSASQTAPHLYLNLPTPVSFPPLCRSPALQMSGQMLHSRILAHPQGGGDLLTA